MITDGLYGCCLESPSVSMIVGYILAAGRHSLAQRMTY